MRKLIATVLCLVAMPAGASNQASLWGTWKVTQTSDPTYSAVMLVDRAGRVVYEDRWDTEYRRQRGLKPIGPGQTKSFGYVKAMGDGVFNVITTNREGVAHSHCTLQSSELAVCDNGRSNMTRMAPGPDNLITPSR